jgi:hypothetical protein
MIEQGTHFTLFFHCQLIVLRDVLKNKKLDQEKIDPGSAFFHLAYNQHHRCNGPCKADHHYDHHYVNYTNHFFMPGLKGGIKIPNFPG